MASLDKVINKNFLETVLPVFGTPRVSLPVWDEDQRMFLYDQYVSASGNRYYKGIRFCDKVVVVEKIGDFHTWTYIDGIEIYAFNGTKLELVQKKDYNKVFRSEEFVREEATQMLCNYISGTFKMAGKTMRPEEIKTEAERVVNECYRSFLDADYALYLTQQILPQIENK